MRSDRFPAGGAVRLLCLVLCLLLVLFQAAALCEEAADALLPEQTDPYEDEDFERFGFGAQVERDDAGNVTQVNGYPVRTVRAGFNSTGYETTLNYEADFLDYPFYKKATDFDGNLAVMSLVMALSANRAAGYNDFRSETYDPSRNVVEFLSDAGFSDIRRDDYSKVPTMHTVSTAMGCRVMEEEGKDPFTLIAVGVCGAGYGNEWISNLTPGETGMHEGFRNAAVMVVDRISGYIATRGIRGRIKIWISGYSRAAAVSNLTAGILDETAMFPKEDIYAYTFATPAGVADPPETGYENIFNIISPMDTVVQTMPGEWGFGRYGTDLMIPTPEFSTFMGSIVQEDREEKNRLNYGIENLYSPMLNFRTRLLYSMVLKLAGSREGYNRLLQPAAEDYLTDKTPKNALTVLRGFLLEAGEIGKDTNADVDRLVDFAANMFLSALTRSGLDRSDRNTGSAFLRLFSEHKDNAYIASVNAIRNGLFEWNTVSWYVLIKGPASVIIQLKGTEEAQAGISSDGTPADGKVPGLHSDPMIVETIVMRRVGDATVTVVPADSEWETRWVAEKDGTVECMILRMRSRADTDYDVFYAPPRRVRAGESANILLPGDPTGLIPTSESTDKFDLLPVPQAGFEKETRSAWQIAKFLGIASPLLNWRTALALQCGLAALIVCGLICLWASHTPRWRRKYGFPVWGLLCVYGAAVAEAEAAWWIFADKGYVRLIWTGAAVLAVTGVRYLVRKKKEGPARQTLLPLTAAIVSVVLMCFSLKEMWIAFAVLQPAIIGWCAYRHKISRIRHAGELFLIGALLAAVYQLAGNDPFVYMAFTLLYHIAMMMLCIL